MVISPPNVLVIVSGAVVVMVEGIVPDETKAVLSDVVPDFPENTTLPSP